MRSIRMTKVIAKMEIDTKFKIKMISLGWLENIANFYKTILRLPIIVIGSLFQLLGTICEGMLGFFIGILNIIDNIPEITFCKQEDRQQLIDIIKKQNEKKYQIK